MTATAPSVRNISRLERLQIARKRLYRCLKAWVRKHICDQKDLSDSKVPRCDLLLFVATDTEKDKLEKVAVSLNLTFKRIKGAGFKYYDLGDVGTYRVMAVKTAVGAFANDGSAARALAAKTETRATGLILLGMAFGTRISGNAEVPEQKMGDLLVSKVLLPYDNRRVRSVSGVAVTDYERVKPYHAKDSLVSVLQRHAALPEWMSRVHFGAMLTGGALIESSLFRDELVLNLSNHGEFVVGGEMEGAGLLAASDPARPIWIIVKGISDFADETRDQDSPEFEIDRATACENAAKFVLNSLLRFDPAAPDVT